MSGTLALECRRVWHRKVERFLADECLSVWHSGTGVLCGLALNPFECRRVWHSPCLGRLGAIRLQDCVQLYSQIAGLHAITQWGCTMGFPLIAELRAIAQSDCRTVCNCAVNLVSWVFVKIGLRTKR